MRGPATKFQSPRSARERVGRSRQRFPLSFLSFGKADRNRRLLRQSAPAPARLSMRITAAKCPKKNVRFGFAASIQNPLQIPHRRRACRICRRESAPPASRLFLCIRRRYSPKVRKTFDCPPGRTMTRGFCSTTVLSAGTLSVTTQFAPMRTLSPTVTPPMIFAPAPI